ncbi:DUF1778 domain-containing protein [Cytophagaceae bacterium YF14B1]|uniref:DUF1778 domain-containing protein n=1 Tax=Xanthocytophaga flava TaxID=3048013 RepID=A0AAE3R0K3_9BACT|nr:DUF1778 domain-containing protein [Xanthocytophaga flavus]MDJ1485903.1 DUF1778 domain-containing protein [Xanthocytophaga flavus]
MKQSINVKQSVKQERIDIRVSQEEKDLFLEAQQISGEKSLTSFLLHLLRDKSKEIIEEKKRILASEQDRNIFFDAIFSDQAPNQALIEAANRYKSLQKT